MAFAASSSSLFFCKRKKPLYVDVPFWVLVETTKQPDTHTQTKNVDCVDVVVTVTGKMTGYFSSSFLCSSTYVFLSSEPNANWSLSLSLSLHIFFLSLRVASPSPYPSSGVKGCFLSSSEAMEYYALDDIVGRRVRPNDGGIEYRVRWHGYPDGSDSWEPRGNLAEHCSSIIQAVDQREMELTDDTIEAWRDTHKGLPSRSTAPQRRPVPSSSRKRSRSPSQDADSDVEVLAGVLVQGEETRTTAQTAASERASVLLLGELIITEEAALALNRTTRRRTVTAEESTVELCAPAMQLEKQWRERFGLSLMHSCVASGAATSVKDAFATDASAAVMSVERAMAGTIEIIGLAPPEETISGSMYAQPTSFVPWIGEDEAERLRRESVAEHPTLAASAQELLRPQRESMVVRYVVTEPVDPHDGDNLDGAPCTAASAECLSSSSSFTGNPPAVEGNGVATQPTERVSAQRFRQTVTSMPLSVFRIAFPQLLLDFLLSHSVALEGGVSEER